MKFSLCEIINDDNKCAKLIYKLLCALFFHIIEKNLFFSIILTIFVLISTFFNCAFFNIAKILSLKIFILNVAIKF